MLESAIPISSQGFQQPSPTQGHEEGRAGDAKDNRRRAAGFSDFRRGLQEKCAPGYLAGASTSSLAASNCSRASRA
ncbi:hypothetical protein RHECNPAF_770071 [Rhizobium etli CNPAF512]|nr:hypothetical protein RHECNPAF_770071 [Rhizobium etli CNPAF512]